MRIELEPSEMVENPGGDSHNAPSKALLKGEMAILFAPHSYNPAESSQPVDGGVSIAFNSAALI